MINDRAEHGLPLMKANRQTIALNLDTQICVWKIKATENLPLNLPSLGLEFHHNFQQADNMVKKQRQQQLYKSVKRVFLKFVSVQNLLSE